MKTLKTLVMLETQQMTRQTMTTAPMKSHGMPVTLNQKPKYSIYPHQNLKPVSWSLFQKKETTTSSTKMQTMRVGLYSKFPNGCVTLSFTPRQA